MNVWNKSFILDPHGESQLYCIHILLVLAKYVKRQGRKKCCLKVVPMISQYIPYSKQLILWFV